MRRLLWPALGVVVAGALVFVVVRSLGGGLGCLIGLRDCEGLTPVVEGKVDTIPNHVIAKDRPTTARPLGRRLTTYRARPRFAVSTGTPDTGATRRYARAVFRADSLASLVDSLKTAQAAGDTTAHPERVPEPPSVLPPAQVRFERGRVRVWGSRSDGSVGRASVQLGPFHPRVTFVMGMDDRSDSIPVIDVDRWFVALGRQGLRCLPRAAIIGGGGGALLAPLNERRERDRLGAALIGSGLVLVGCLIG